VIGILNKPAAEDLAVCGDSFDWVLAHSKDVVAPDCEKVFVGLDTEDRFFGSISESFFEGLPEFFLRIAANPTVKGGESVRRVESYGNSALPLTLIHLSSGKGNSQKFEQHAYTSLVVVGTMKEDPYVRGQQGTRSTPL
jgi:hypothetical protein